MNSKDEKDARWMAWMQLMRLMRLREVLAITGLSKSTIYALIAGGQFPRPVRIGRRAVGWRASEVQAWVTARPSAAGENGG